MCELCAKPARPGLSRRGLIGAISAAMAVAAAGPAPTASVSPDDAPAHFTWMANFIGLDAPASGEFTMELLHWEPTHIGLIADLDEGHYFTGAVRPFNA